MTDRAARERKETAKAPDGHGEPGRRSQPIGITHGPDGAVWFAEALGNKIGRLDVRTVGRPIAPGVRAPEPPDPAVLDLLDPE